MWLTQWNLATDSHVFPLLTAAQVLATDQSLTGISAAVSSNLVVTDDIAETKFEFIPGANWKEGRKVCVRLYSCREPNE